MSHHYIPLLVLANGFSKKIQQGKKPTNSNRQEILWLYLSTACTHPHVCWQHKADQIPFQYLNLGFLLFDHQKWHSGHLKGSLEAGQEAKKIVWQPYQIPSISQLFYPSRDLERVKRVRGIWSEVQEQFRCSSNDLRAPRHITHPLSAVTRVQKEQWNTPGSKHWKGA